MNPTDGLHPPLRLLERPARQVRMARAEPVPSRQGLAAWCARQIERYWAWAWAWADGLRHHRYGSWLGH